MGDANHELGDVAVARGTVGRVERRADGSTLLGDDAALLRRRLALADCTDQVPELLCHFPYAF